MATATPGRADTTGLRVLTVAVTLWCLVQAPGRIVPETKLDVTLDPAGFLGQALGAWDPTAFGRLQNQAAGYLFPLGPFSLAGRWMGLPPWVVQRLWIAAVILVGLWGAHRVAAAVGVATAPGRLVAAAAYALAPASLGIVAFQSATQVPYALAPWVLVPLFDAARLGPRRAAARSALAVLAMGGVNGTATVAVLPLAVVWLATRAPGPARRRLAAWWGVGLLAAVVWWLVPLVVTVRYGVRFTAYTEQADLTTGTQNATDLWRGTSNWLAYVRADGRSWLPGSWQLVIAPVAIAGSVAVAAAGAVGLVRRDAPGRAWLLPVAVLGAAAMGAGYAGAGAGSFADPVRTLLDGALAPFRNVHKFSALIRLPLAIGLGHLVVTATAALAARSPAADGADRPDPADRPVRALRSWGPAAVAGLAVLAAVGPLLPARLTAPGGFERVPAAWEEAAAWVDARPGDARALLLPAAPFGEYTWGRPLDEPFGILAETPWAVRDLIPLGGNGSTRLLDGLEDALRRDHLPPGFVTALQRAGVGHVVVRNDLVLDPDGGPAPTTLRRLLGEVLDLEAGFGDEIEQRATDDGRVGPRPGGRADPPIRAVEVYAVPEAVDRVTSYPAAGPLVTGGGPEALVDLRPELVDGRAVVLAGDVDALVDAGGAEDPVTATTDTARRRDVAFGAVRSSSTHTLTADEASPLTGGEPTDRWPDEREPPLTTARWVGAAEVVDDDPIGRLEIPGTQPFAAFDGDRATAWTPRPPARGRSLEIRLADPRPVPAVTVRIPTTAGERVAELEVATDGGIVRLAIGPDGTARAELPPGPTATVRLTILSTVAGAPLGPVGLSEVALEGLDIARPLVTASPGPGPDPTPADVAVLTRHRTDASAVGAVDEDAAIDRVVELTAGRRRVSGLASARPGPALDALLASVTPGADDDSLRVEGDSGGGPPAHGAERALDGDPTTAWVSPVAATDHRLDLAWSGPEVVEEIVVDQLVEGVGRIREVTVVAGDLRVTRPLPASGRLTIPPTRTDRLTLLLATGAAEGVVRRVGIAEIRVDALAGRVAPTPDRSEVLALACGEGPTLTIDGRPFATRAEATVADLVDGAPVAWEACAGLDLAAGAYRVRTAPHGADAAGTGEAERALVADQVVVVPEGGLPPAPEARSTTVDRWDDRHRTVEVGAGPATVLTTTENVNDGWEAEFDGRRLDPVVIDGWRQGFVVPAGDGGVVTMVFAPDRLHRAGLAVGAVAVLGLLALALIPGRRDERERSRTPLAERPWSDTVALTIAACVGVVLGGPAVIALLPLLAVARRRRDLLPAVVGGLVLLAGIVTIAPVGADWAVDNRAYLLGAQLSAVVAWIGLAVAAVGLRDEGADEDPDAAPPEPVPAEPDPSGQLGLVPLGPAVTDPTVGRDEAGPGPGEASPPTLGTEEQDR